MNHKLKSINNKTIIYARPDGWHYHLDRNCDMLQGVDFERFEYTTITTKDIRTRHLRPCPCSYEDYQPHKLLKKHTEVHKQ